MFIRKLKNRSGSVSIQAIEKKNGRYYVVKSFGSSKDPNEIEKLLFAAKTFLLNPTGTSPLFQTLSEEDIAIDSFFRTLENEAIQTIGPELIFGALFDRIGSMRFQTFSFAIWSSRDFPTLQAN